MNNDTAILIFAGFAGFLFVLVPIAAFFLFWTLFRDEKAKHTQADHERELERETLTPDFNGNYPARITRYGVIAPTPGNIVQPVPYSLHFAPQITQTTEPPRPLINSPELAAQTPAPGLPTAPDLSELVKRGWQPTKERMLLGYNLLGPVYGGVADLLSVGIAGRPGQGKSTLLRLILWQIITAGGRCLVLDPHGSILEDMAAAPVDFEASSSNELTQAGAWMEQELEIRLAQRREGKRDFTPMLSLCDELPVISLSSKAASAAIGRVVLEGRKVSMFALISGQGLPAENFGGRLVRDALSSRYVFKTSNMEGQRAGLDKETAKLLEQLTPGRAILAGIVEPGIVAIPNTTGADLERLTPQRATTPPIYEEGVILRADPKSPTANDGAEQSLEDRAVAAWREGANSVRKLAAALSITRYQSEQLIRNLGLVGGVSD